MKKISIKILSIALFVLILGSSITSVASLYNVQNQKSPDTSAYNQDGMCRGTPKIEAILEMIDEDLLREYLERLVEYGPRMTGTYGCEKSAEYIYSKFTEIGLEARYQNWTRFGNRNYPRIFKSQNIEGTLFGNNCPDDNIILFNAHYDTVKRSPGADDNGGGVAAVLAAAYALSQFQFNHTIKFVSFSGEEVGFLGSYEYVKESYNNKDDILVDLNADMIAYTGTGDAGSKFLIYGTQDVQWIMEIIEELNFAYDIDFELDQRILNEDARHGGSDYFIFMKYGYEAISFFESEWNPYLHTPNDTIEHINFSYLVNTTRLIVATIAFLADNEYTYPQIQIESPQFGKLYYKGMKRCNIRDLNTIVIDDIWIWAEVKYAMNPIERVEFYYDELLVFTDTEYPYKWHFNKLSIGKHRITVIAYDQYGRRTSSFKDILFINVFRNR